MANKTCDLSSDKDLTTDDFHSIANAKSNSLSKMSPKLSPCNYGGRVGKLEVESKETCESGLGESLNFSEEISSIDNAYNKNSPQQSSVIEQADSLYTSEPMSLEEKTSVSRSITEKSGSKSLVEGIGSVVTELSNLIVSLTVEDHDIKSAVIEEEEEEDIDIFVQDADGDTILHEAIIEGAEKVALAVIDLATSTESLNIVNNLYQAPLHLAVLMNQLDVVKKLLENGADVFQKDRQGNCSLHIACRQGHLDTVDLILGSLSTPEKSRLLTIRNYEGLACLHIVMLQRYFDVASCLFTHGADPNIREMKSGRSVLHYMSERKDVSGIKFLLKIPNIDVNAQTFKGETPLLLAYWRNYQDIVKRLKAKGAYFVYDLLEDLDCSDSDSDGCS